MIYFILVSLILGPHFSFGFIHRGRVTVTKGSSSDSSFGSSFSSSETPRSSFSSSVGSSFPSSNIHRSSFDSSIGSSFPDTPSSSFGSSFRSSSSHNTIFIDSTAQAALAYVENAVGEDACGQLAKVYIKSVLSGKSQSDAISKAKDVYISNYKAGIRPEGFSACHSAQVAFKEAYENGGDPVLAAALAYMKNYKYESDISPCFAAATDYVEAVLDGYDEIDARLKAAKSFTHKIKTLAKRGKPTIDKACIASAKAFAAVSDIPSTPAAKAMQAFITKALETGKGFDPACNSAAERFIDSFTSGKSELDSTLAAAKEFLTEYKYYPSPAANSPCTAATKAYAAAIRNSPSHSTENALFAFVDAAVLFNDDGLDPVCGAAAEEYLDAYLTGAGEAEASEAAAIAYLNAIHANPNFDLDSPCGRAGKAYIDTFR